MALKYVNVPLFEDAFYGYSITLEGDSYNLEFLYNERMELYTLSLFDAAGVPIVRGHAVVPSYPMLADYPIENLTGFFWLEELANINRESYKEYPQYLSKYYRMFYIYDDGV